MKNRLFICIAMVLATGLVILSCEKDEQENKPLFTLDQADQISEESYFIYSLVINDIFSSEKIVIEQKTSTDLFFDYESNYYDYLIENYPDFDTSLVQVHVEINKNSSCFDNKFTNDNNQIVLISSDELSYIFDGHDLNSDWSEFFKYYENSNGVVHLTLIAFNEDKTQAIFEIGRTYASLGGEGMMVFLKKIGGEWNIIDYILTWLA
ncbi:MAG: hypothetical protein JXB00_01090 [Bacteroidales bacterium]|nr:hypothetical protein [Bacteroidales bacterium]